jgi:hypothetical protein
MRVNVNGWMARLAGIAAVWLVMLMGSGAWLTAAQGTATPDLQATINVLNAQLTQQAQTQAAPSQPITPSPISPTAIPTLDPAASPTSPLLALTPVVGLTPLPTIPPVIPIAAPPLLIQPPRDWRFGYFETPSGDLTVRGNVSVAVYTGPIRGGTATIVILWNYPSIQPPTSLGQPNQPTRTPLPNPLGLDAMQLQLHRDGLRLLKGTVLDITCNIGNYGLRTDLTVGKLPAIGENFAASQCQSDTDVIGWFAGLRQHGKDYLFYVYVEPLAAFNDLAWDVQGILDTVQFVAPEQQTLTPQPSPVLAVTATPVAP